MKHDEVWSEVLALLREEVGSRVVETWFRALVLVRYDRGSGEVLLQPPNAFVREWVTNRYKAMLERHITRVLHPCAPVKLLVGEGPMAQQGSADNRVNMVPSPVAVSPIHAPQGAAPLMNLSPERPRERRRVGERAQIGEAFVPATRIGGRPDGARGAMHGSALVVDYQFDNFVVGSHNSLAYAAAYAVVERLGQLYNPFFIYGSSGLGKTHLLHAIGNAVRTANKTLKIYYQSANSFVAEFIQAIRFDKVYLFEARFKEVDLFLIDDVQFLSNKEQTQELFFHIFNTLHHQRKQIVCTSDSLPRDIAGLAERIRSRLESGLVADISFPSLETRIAILKKKAEQQQLLLPDDAAEYVASLGGGNIREIEGMLIRLSAHASITGCEVSLELARVVFADQVNVGGDRQGCDEIDLKNIAMAVARRFGYSLEQLRSRDRHKDITYARHVALYLMKRLSQRSLREIAKYVHRTDHSTVLHAIEKLELLVRTDGNVRVMMGELERTIRVQHRVG